MKAICPNCGFEVEPENSLQDYTIGCPNDGCMVATFYGGGGGIVDESNVKSY